MSNDAIRSSSSAHTTPRLAESKPPYIGIFLNEDSKARLLAWWKSEVGLALLPDMKTCHVTLVFDPSDDDDVARYRPFFGTVGRIQVCGWAADERGQAVLVQSYPKSRNALPHITVAVAPGVSGSYSNELLARGFSKVWGPHLEGVVSLKMS